MSDARADIDQWSAALAELRPRRTDTERYRRLWRVAADAVNAFAYASGKAEGLMLAPARLDAMRAAETAGGGE